MDNAAHTIIELFSTLNSNQQEEVVQALIKSISAMSTADEPTEISDNSEIDFGGYPGRCPKCGKLL